MGFVIAGALRPSYYYGKQHDYVYYPASWTDPISNTSYEEGFYDENGQYYKSVAFPQNGTYENVVCRCPYCGRESILNLSQDDVYRHDLECSHCGGPMEIVSTLDEYCGGATSPEERPNTHVYASEESLRKFREKPKKKRRGCLTAFVITSLVFVFLYALGSYSIAKQEREAALQNNQPVSYGENDGTPAAQQGNGVLSLEDDDGGFGEKIALRPAGEGSFVITDSSLADSAEKLLLWDREAESYYDPDTECWLWFNTDVSPSVWQYWYEGISSDYGDYGWMEHEDSGWYIETDNGRWERLPERYDTARLWYIAG